MSMAYSEPISLGKLVDTLQHSPEKLEQSWENLGNKLMPHRASDRVRRRRLFQPVCGNRQHCLGSTQWEHLNW